MYKVMGMLKKWHKVKMNIIWMKKKEFAKIPSHFGSNSNAMTNKVITKSCNLIM